MIEFERSHEHIQGRSVAITSWHDHESDTWKANAPGFVMPLGRIDRPGLATRRAAVAQTVREVEQMLIRSQNTPAKEVG